MNNADSLINTINNGKLDEKIFSIYGDNSINIQRDRYIEIINKMQKYFPDQNTVHLFSTPGRTELGGNHTDHNHGRVLAGSVQLDTVAAVSKSDDMIVQLYSEGFTEPFIVDLNHLKALVKEKDTTVSLVRGIAARLAEYNYKIGGFKGFISSNILKGSGLSSSAAIEILIGTIFNHLFNEGRISLQFLAVTGQYAENHYFGKPCGLMDQLACANGGIIGIDFMNPEEPVIEKINIDFTEHGYHLLVVDTGGNHADLTEDYAGIPLEMKELAKELGKNVCRDISKEQLFDKLKNLRKNVGDRAILRGLHFINENNRVKEQIVSLKKREIELFLNLVNESGESSWQYLQNCFTNRYPREQGISLALALTKEFLAGKGACRVHGGGFAGTIQVYVPNHRVKDYINYIEAFFDEGCVTLLKIRKEPATLVI